VPTRSIFRPLAVVLLLLSVAACGQAAVAANAYVRVSESSIVGSGPIAVPATVALTITGRLSGANSGAGLALDVASIERMGLVRYTVRDPWLGKDLEFTGVLVSDLLRISGAAADAQTLHVTALDDYVVDISIADAQRWPIMLATQMGGVPMSIEDKGPTRIVFPADPTIDALKYKDLWVWQIKTIEVR
jgi:hypothetical protein